MEVSLSAIRAGFFFARMKVKIAYLYALGAVLAWSTVSTAFKLSLRHLTPLGLLLFSSVAATLFLAGTFLAQAGSHGSSSIPGGVHHAGLLNPFIYYLMLFVAYDRLRARKRRCSITLGDIAFPAFGLAAQAVPPQIAGAAVKFSGSGGHFHPGTDFPVQFDDPRSLLAVSTSLVWASYWILNLKDTRDAKGKLLNFLGTLATALYALLRGK